MDVKEENIFSGAAKDESIDLDALTSLMNNNSSKETTTQEKVEEKPLTPLEQMKANKVYGAVVSNEDLEKGKEKPIQNFAYNEKRVAGMEAKVSEFDETLKKRTSAVVIRQPENAQEYTEMMMEIDSIEFDGDGKAYFNYETDDHVKLTPKFIRLRTENDPEFSMETDKLLLEGVKPEDITANPGDNSKQETSSDTNEKAAAEADSVKSVVNIFIDKTGLGNTIEFTEEEKQKIIESDEIRLRAVKVMDINTFKNKKSDVSFQDTLNTYQASQSTCSVYFPASGFSATMNGLTYGEMADISLDMNNATVEQYRKRLTVIYNKMTNISTGPFADFEDFLKNFSYIDIPMALYGLFVATQPEVQQVQLDCSKCRTSYDISFTTRGIFKLDKCGKVYLKKMEELLTASPADYDSIRENSSVIKSNFVELPYSKINVEFGLMSAYDYLYNWIPLNDEELIKSAFGQDAIEDPRFIENILLILGIRSISIPVGDGTYATGYGYKDIMQGLSKLIPSEIKIVTFVVQKMLRGYEVAFSLGRSVCPKCKTVTEDVPVDMDDLVFQIYQRLTNTEIDVENMLDF